MYNEWKNYCNQLCVNNNNEEFSQFKRHPHVTYMLEHVNREFGVRFAERITDEIPQDWYDWSAIRKHDSIGNSQMDIFSLYGRQTEINPSTLRYMYHAGKICQQLLKIGKRDLRIVEIGGGYGALAYILTTMINKLSTQFNLSVKSYTIFDLAEVGRLQRKYLECLIENEQKDIFKYLTMDDLQKSQDQYDFLISCYCLSEIPEDIRRLYYNSLVKDVPNGFLLWNNLIGGTDNECPFNLPNSSIEMEDPQTGHVNKLITFMSSSQQV